MRAVLLLMVFAVWSGGAVADSFADLVEERARASLGSTLPEDGRFTIRYQPEIDDALLISRFWMDAISGQFLAEVVRETGEVQRVSGLALVSVPVPVPTRRLMPDEIIAESDLITIDLPLGRLNDFSVTNVSDLVGRQVRRMLPEGRPVMVQSVMAPLVIDRGERVRIRFEDGSLVLTAPGRALNDAAAGETVRVVNLVSNLSLVGTARPDGIVEIVR
ncbi:flagellar basal body P-ring formation chaperone FlgA [Roseibacterium sp. SDUM158016]|uniref:flagellar basal body P-ring formation chaperone FlgA n=1 Tax=Roseicyclus sediminis TaxID=2980997 RepID=UPI0021D1A9F3|nr:flagellar basal body P-ring formation chaperone FlgA [Roseibacterium sp. SDUM158016]MCU4654339.1 flagellar basal body P-ring formation chaperone FlgA [Roseibacterium sp. SDUM158016]